MAIVAIHGKKRTGKDTLAMMLREGWRHRGEPLRGDWVTKAFADPLKSMASKRYGVPLDHFYRDDLKEVVLPAHGMSPRDMLKVTEGDVKREQGEDFFATLMSIEVAAAERKGQHVLITDLRFEVELRWLQSVGATLIHVTRDTGHQDHHLSEAGLDEHLGRTDVLVVANNGSLEDLAAIATGLAEEVNSTLDNHD